MLSLPLFPLLMHRICGYALLGPLDVIWNSQIPTIVTVIPSGFGYYLNLEFPVWCVIILGLHLHMLPRVMQEVRVTPPRLLSTTSVNLHAPTAGSTSQERTSYWPRELGHAPFGF